MIRQLIPLGALLVLVGPVALASAAPAPPGPPNQEVPVLVEKLSQPVKFDGFEADPKMTLQEALDHLADRYDLIFDVNELAFKAEKLDNVLSVPVAERAIPKMINVRLETVLRKILARVRAPSGTTYLIRGNVIEITTRAAVRAEVWGPDHKGPMLPLVNITFEKRLLNDALKELAGAADYSIVLDPRVADKARVPVSAGLENVALDTAVRLLADAAQLQPVLMDRVLYVTTPENAARLAQQEQKNTPAAAAGSERERPAPVMPPARE